MNPTARRLLGYFRPHAPALLLATAMMGLQAAVPGVLVFLVKRVLDDVLIARDPVMLGALPLLVVGLYLLGGALNVGRGLLTRSIALEVIERLRGQVYARLLRLDLGWHQRHPAGELVARLTNDAASIQYAVSGVITAIQKPATLVVLLGSALYLNPRLAVVAVALLPLVGWPIARFGARLRAAARDANDNLAALSALSQESLAGVRVVQGFGAETALERRFEALNAEQRRHQLAATLAQLLPGPVIELVAAIGVGGVVWVGGRQVFAGQLTPGALVAFLVALGLLNDPLKGVAQIYSLLQRALASADALFGLLDTAPGVPDTGTVELEARSLTIRFEGVDFAYPSREGAHSRPVLRGVDLEVPAGRVVAVVGASGAGKSTLASLIPRFYDVGGGRLLLGGHDVRALTLASLRRCVAMVSQDSFLFDDSIRANIALGVEASDAAIEAAARAANAHDFIAALPQGYQTRVDTLGQRLSGGQRQRICIARAVLRDAPVLVLDEATSALDAESEALVQSALERLMRDRTVLAIAHRLSTIRDADEIVVLDEGRVVERGPHEALLARGGVYARLVRRQEGTAG